jgi:hypothetical protein
MPVITRNQSKKTVACTTVTPMEQYTARMEKIEEFNKEIRRLLNECDFAEGKTAKMQVVMSIYNLLNNDIELFMCLNYLTAKHLTFAATTYNKTTELEAQYINNEFDDIDDELVRNCRQSYLKVRTTIATFFKQLRNDNPDLSGLKHERCAEMYANIDLCDNQLEMSG